MLRFFLRTFLNAIETSPIVSNLNFSLSFVTSLKLFISIVSCLNSFLFILTRLCFGLPIGFFRLDVQFRTFAVNYSM